MKPRHTYLLLCILGFALPYSQFVPWLMENGLHMKYFVQQLFANRVGGFFALDVLVSAIVLLRFVSYESKRLRMRAVGPDSLHAAGRSVARFPVVLVSAGTRLGEATS